MDVLFDFSPVFDRIDDIALGFWATIRLSLMAGILSLILGTFLVAMRVAPVRIFRAAGTLYVNIFRNTPLTLILAFCALGLSDTLHIRLSNTTTVNNYWLAVFGLSAYTAAFICEALRAGINTVPLGQAEASRAIGLSFFQSLRLIILPQAFRSIIAPLGSIFIAMVKNTTVVIVASYIESAYMMRQLFEEEGATIPMFAAFAIGFMILTLPMGFFFGWLAKRLAVTR